MRTVNCTKLLGNFTYSNDVRRYPDTSRRGRFHEGWEDAAIRSMTYTPQTLQRLTWSNLGYRLGKHFGIRPTSEINFFFEQFATHYRKTHSQSNDTYSSPDEVEMTFVYREGAVRQILVNAYERNSEARQLCIDKYGAVCCVCQFDFGEIYGEDGEGYIHVHHLRQLSSIGEEYEINPITDLRPVCPNCHAVIHRRTPAYSIEEVQAMIKRTRRPLKGDFNFE